MIFVTGGAGFIGANFIHNWLSQKSEAIVNIDKLTYAGNLQSLEMLGKNENYVFAQVDICDAEKITDLFRKYSPRAILNFAAESHVDRSINSPAEFIQTNIIGTFNLLECALEYWKAENQNPKFRFQHISTDEVYGSLGDTGLFTEQTPYDPSSPYSASKASSDHLVRAWERTYGLPVLITNCSNNYGPYHFPEKLIPLIIQNALQGKALPVYGDGKQVREDRKSVV